MEKNTIFLFENYFSSRFITHFTFLSVAILTVLLSAGKILMLELIQNERNNVLYAKQDCRV